MLLPRASLKRAPRTRTRKNTTSPDKDIVYPPSRSQSLARRKTRPPPLQIIPELSENELDDITHSPATARPMPSTPRPTRITLSSYTFSIDDALLMFGSDVLLSPTLSTSSSSSDGTSSEDVPATPRSSADEDDHMFRTPSLRPQRISIRPLCITKTRSLICQEDEDIHGYCEQEEEKAFCLPATECHDQLTEVIEAAEDFYAREFEDFLSLLPAMPSPTSPARRDSLIIITEALPAVFEAAESKPRGRSRHSKPLPLLPPVTPPISFFPSVSTPPLVQTTAPKSSVRRKRNIPPLPSYPPSLPVVCRPLPRMTVPLDVDDCVLPEESLDVPSGGSIFVEQDCEVEEDASIYSEPSFTYTVSAGARILPPAIPETPFSGMYGEVTLPRSSTDSDGPRSSVDTTLSFGSSISSDSSISPLSSPGSPCEGRLCSRWSTSTLASLVVEPSRSTHLLFPLKSVFGSRPRRVPPPKRIPPQPPQRKHCFTGKHVPRQNSRSSTSSSGTNPSECDSRDGSPIGLKRKPIPVAMFLRAAQ